MLELAAIFQSNMMLQREKPVKVWGTAEKHAAVTVEIQGQQAKTNADEKGYFQVVLNPLTASEEEQLHVSAGEEELTLKHVAVGEIWIAGGQSNMEFFMEFEKHISEERPQCENSNVRFYDVPEVAFEGQLEAFDYHNAGVWRKASQEEIGYFSAVAYYFQKDLNRELNVPVGIVGCNWGGTRASAWMKQDTVRKVGKLWMDDYEKAAAKLDMNTYYEEQKTNPLNDRGLLIDDPFTRFMLPGTPSQEEIQAFYGGVELDLDDFINALLPHSIPGSLYEHMVKKIGGFASRGVLWYQGESDDDIPGGQAIYGDMLTAMIQDWRELWQDQLPFLIVQIPGWESWLGNENHDYATIREQQEKVTKTLENTYLCSISDVGEQFDIHPKDKKTVGERLAKLAFGHIYGQNILCDAPKLSDAKLEGDSIYLTFANAGTGMKLSGEQLNALEVKAGEEALDFSATVSADQVVLKLAEQPQNKITVSFARAKWYQVNLYNSADIPAIPFLVTL